MQLKHIPNKVKQKTVKIMTMLDDDIGFFTTTCAPSTNIHSRFINDKIQNKVTKEC